MIYSQDELQLLLNKIPAEYEYAAQRFIEDTGWSEIYPSEIKTLKEARQEALLLSKNYTSRVVKISKYVSGEKILATQVIQIWNKRKD